MKLLKMFSRTGFLAVLMVMSCALGACSAKEAAPPHLEKASFADISGWDGEDFPSALDALLVSCAGSPPEMAEGFGAPLRVERNSWLMLCAEAQATPSQNPAAARAFFERRFIPWRIDTEGARAGHFTGYYVPVLRASRSPGGAFLFPAYGLPPELKDGTARLPYFDRKAIDRGALAGRHLELLWFDDPVMLFFAHVQGSATVDLAEGGQARLSFAGKNGHSYHPIGRTLVERGELEPEEVSMQSIRDWLRAHPEQAMEVMETNPSYIFFSLEEIPGRAVRGALGTPLTPGRSLAVDREFVPLGLPVFIETSWPGSSEPLSRLMMAQDTGSAIRGAGRGDLFFGYGAEAEALAGGMNAPGTMYLLLPIAD